MDWKTYFYVAAAIFFGSIVLAFVFSRIKYKSGRVLTPFNLLFIGVVLSALTMFLPIYTTTFETSQCGPFEAVFVSIHNMIRLFAGDGDFEFVTEVLGAATPEMFSAYSKLFSVLFVMAPILTFGFVLSFMKNISANLKYVKNFFCSAFVFSELNEKSLALASDLKKKRWRVVVFAGVNDTNNDLYERAREIGAICFKRSIAESNFALHCPLSTISFFAIGKNQSDNILTALKLVERYKNRKRTKLYVFASGTDAEMVLSGRCGQTKVEIHRVNDVQSLIFRNLYETGYQKIFESAYTDTDGVKKINALIIGMGQHGTEMTKALSWFCQMDGYRPEINCFDIQKTAEERFVSLCPELMDKKFNGKFNLKGETQYKITIHPDMDVQTAAFDEKVKALARPTYIFISLGSDELNMAVAVKLRAMFMREGAHPQIQAVIYDDEKKMALAGVKNYSGQPYDIDFIGDVESAYTEAVILGSDLEQIALLRHKKWGEERTFWQYDYNYKSSIASAIHSKMKRLCGISGIEKTPEEREENEKTAIRILEHRRWNAYMRSEGYVYSGSTEKASRNNLAKQHNCLVAFSKLPLSEQEKDDD